MCRTQLTNSHKNKPELLPARPEGHRAETLMNGLSCEAIARAALGEPLKRERAELLYRCPRPERHTNGDAHPSLKINAEKKRPKATTAPRQERMASTSSETALEFVAMHFLLCLLNLLTSNHLNQGCLPG